MNKIVLVFIISFFYQGFSQKETNSINELALTYGKYFELPRESIFLHLNKSTYIVGEDIWFKGYIYNRRKALPFKETTNLYIGLYNSDGKQLKKSLYYANDGYSQGSIVLDSTIQSGEYYIKASTHWMRNFNEDDAYQQKVTIYNESIPEKSINKTTDYDMQFLPEGGNLVEGVLNTVGVKLIDNNGLGVKIDEAIVKDYKGNQVAVFNTSKFGLGKFFFTPDNSRIYSVKIIFKNGIEKTFLLPKAQKEGINIRIEDSDDKRIVISLSTNTETKNKIRDKSFHLLIQRDGLISKIKVNFPKNQLYVSILLAKKELHDFMNIITLVDYKNRPILERLFFNWTNFKNYNFKVVKKEQKFDSIAIKIQSQDIKRFLKKVSLSVLPQNSRAYNHTNTILSTFYLKPYVKGFIENPSYYFKSVTQRKKNELDLLLLTQGWSRYDWKDITLKPPINKFDFEQGLVIEALVKSKIRDEDRILLHKSENHDSQEISLSDSIFTLGKLYPILGEKLYFSHKNKRGKLSKPDMYVVLKTNIVEDNLLLFNPSTKSVRKSDNSAQVDMGIRKNFILKKNTVILNEVVVSAQKKNSLAENNSLVPKYMKDKVTEVDVTLARNYPKIADILRSKGYEVAEELQLIPNINPNSQPVPPISRVNIKSRRGGGVLLIIDGVRQENLDVIYQFPTEQIESFYFDRLSRYEGAMSQNKETLYLFTRRGKELNLTPISTVNNENSFVFDVSNGFEPIKQFYSPKYATYLDDSFENFGVIHWEPSLTLDDNGEATFKILNTGMSKLSFFIEGMGKDGSLISSIISQN